MTLRNKLCGIGVATVFTFTLGGVATAQDPEAGETGSWQGGWGQPPQGGQQGGWGQPPRGGQQGGWGQPQGSGGMDTERPPSAGGTSARGGESEGASWDNGDDHLAVVGHLGVGFFGTLGVPIGGSDSGVSAPTVGMRYWLSETIGLDAALGFGFTSNTRSVNNVSASEGSFWALAVRGGLPIALAHHKHYKFLLVPELAFGISGGSAPNRDVRLDDTIYSGFLLSVGGRVGTEIHFGFIGVPQLSLQGSIGLLFNYVSVSTDECQEPPSCGMSRKVSLSTVSLGTVVYQAPWDLFTGSIAAIYYF